jgi:hypothetical protein
MGKLEGKRILERQGRKWVGNVKMDLGEVKWGDVEWIGLPQDRDKWRAFVNSLVNLRIP